MVSSKSPPLHSHEPLSQSEFCVDFAYYYRKMISTLPFFDYGTQFLYFNEAFVYIFPTKR